MTDHPFTRLEEARADLAAVEVRRDQVLERIANIRQRVADLEFEISASSGRSVDAILSDSAEPSEKELLKRVERTAVLRAKLDDLSDRLNALEQEDRKLEGLIGETSGRISEAERGCLRLLEADYLQRYHVEAARLLAEVVLPMRTIGRALVDCKEASSITRLLTPLRIPAINPELPPGSSDSVCLWAEGHYLIDVNLPRDLLIAVQDPKGEVVEGMIQQLAKFASPPPVESDG